VKLIQTVTVTAAFQASVEFTSIPQDGTDLVILISARGDTTGTGAGTVFAKFNTSTTEYYWRVYQGSGSAVSNSVGTHPSAAAILVRAGATANTFSNAEMRIFSYSAAVRKLYSTDAVGENNALEAYQQMIAGQWSFTDAITALTFTTTNSFITGTTFSLYKITKGTDGIVTTSP
jgi:hypothetical protein